MNLSPEPRSELQQKLQWLIFSRAIFTALLFGSTIFIHINRLDATFDFSLFILYGIIVALSVLSFFYAFFRPRVRREVLFAYVQIVIDSAVVTLGRKACRKTIFDPSLITRIVCFPRTTML